MDLSSPQDRISLKSLFSPTSGRKKEWNSPTSKAGFEKIVEVPKIITVENPADFRQKVEELAGFVSDFSLDPSENRLPFILLCYLFPFGSRFTKQDIVSLWIAEGLVEAQGDDGREEDKANDIFDSLVARGVIVPSGVDRSVDFFNPKVRIPIYKVNETFETVRCNDRYATISGNDFYNVSENVHHLSVLCKSISQVYFEAMKRFVDLRSLFLFSSRMSPVEQIPRDLFLWLKNLRSLNLSRSLVSELPSSIGNLKLLKYIDLSYTPIKRLPDSIDSLHNLQTLKLRFCFNLFALPKNMRKLTNLRHLDFDVMGQLRSMPSGMGNLTKLQTLSAFLVGKEDGNKIVELKNTANLTGSFCISRLDNVSSCEEAKEAGLGNKKFLTRLELRWPDRRLDIDESTMEEEKEILEHLQPPLGIEELRVLHYCGPKLPNWISDPSYARLVDITLFGCRISEFLPSFGELPSLEILNIKEMNELRRIDHRLCRKDNDQQKQAFPRLQKLTIEAMSKLEEWTGIQNGDFPELHTLKVEHCPQLMSLPLLSYLCSLKRLELIYCPKILALPDQDLSHSLELFMMNDCPQLKERCQKGEGEDWGKVAHVPKILVDYEKISWQLDVPAD